MICIVLTGVLVDILPYYEITYDPLLTGIFGGLINGFAIGVCLRGNATTGGTDFISALLSKKYKIDSWNYIFAGNVSEYLSFADSCFIPLPDVVFLRIGYGAVCVDGVFPGRTILV